MVEPFHRGNSFNSQQVTRNYTSSPNYEISAMQGLNTQTTLAAFGIASFVRYSGP